MAPPTSIPWGTIALILDNEACRQGFLAARGWYFEDIYGQDGRRPEEPHRTRRLSSEEVLRLVVMPDEQGRSHFDEMGYENLASIPGLSRRLAFVDHLPLRKQSITAKNKPNRNIFVGAYQRRMMSDGKTSRRSFKGPEHAPDYHRQTQAHHHTAAVSGAPRDPTGLS